MVSDDIKYGILLQVLLVWPIDLRKDNIKIKVWVSDQFDGPQSPEELSGLYIQDVLIKEDLERVQNQITQVLTFPTDTESLNATKYIQSHTVHRDINKAFNEERGMSEPYDGIAEIWWENIEAALEALGSPAGQEANKRIIENEANFIDPQKMCLEDLFYLAKRCIEYHQHK